MANTKTKILDAAEKLFTEQGIDGTSLRAIIKKAGVNLAAVHYHFHSKERLIQKVFKRRINPLNQMRLELLDKYESEAGGKPLKVEDIITAFIQPVLVEAQRSPQTAINAMQLTMQAIALPTKEIREPFHLLFDDVMEQFHAAFYKSLPHLSEAEFGQRIHLVVISFVYSFLSFAHRDDLDNKQFTKSELGKMGLSITTFVTAGLMAPATKSGKK